MMHTQRKNDLPRQLSNLRRDMIRTEPVTIQGSDDRSLTVRPREMDD
jgi:hypothetical protein